MSNPESITTQATAPTASAAPLATATHAPLGTGLLLGGGFLWSTLYVYIGGAPFLYMELHNVSPSQFGIFFGVNAAGLIAVAQVNARLLRTRSPGVLLRGGAILVAVASVSLLLAVLTGLGGVAGVAIPIFFMLSGLGLVGGNISSAALAPFPKAAGSASALMGTVQFSIGAVCGAVAAALHNSTGVMLATVIAVVAVIGTVICFRYDVGDSQQGD